MLVVLNFNYLNSFKYQRMGSCEVVEMKVFGEVYGISDMITIHGFSCTGTHRGTAGN
jgi:hypothetical protein